MSSELFRVAIVGASTLKGREVGDVLNDRNFPAQDVKLLDAEDALGQLETVGDEVSFVQAVHRSQFEKTDFAFFATEAEFTRKNWELAQNAGCTVVDLSYALEGEKGASIRAPWIEREIRSIPVPDLQPGPVVTAHPAAQVLALVLLRLHAVSAIRVAAATVFEPASERGKAGMDELHEQTVNLLSFRELPKGVFDAQIAFNMVAQYGENAATSIEAVERRVIGHYRRITEGRLPVPSLMLVQAPSFHGHAFSVYVELESPIATGDLLAALQGSHIDTVGTGEDSPSNVTAAGQDDILVTARQDAQHDRAFWLWAAADNLRIAAMTAVECAEAMVAARPKGKVQ